MNANQINPLILRVVVVGLLASSGVFAATTISTDIATDGALAISGNTTLGDSATDTLTINSTAVSIPNTLNIGANTFYINATTPNPKVAIGTNTPANIANFQIHNPSAAGTGFVITDNVSGTSDGNGFGLYFNGTTNEVSFVNFEDGPVVWYTGVANDSRMRLSSIGNLALGTDDTTPRFNIRADSSSPSTNIFQISNSNDSVRYMTISSTTTSIQTNVDLESGTGSVSANAVTINAATGVITDATDINLDSTRAAITLTNSRIAATSVVTVSNCSTPDAGAALVSSVAPGAGNAILTVRNVGTGNQTSTWKVCFTVTN